MYIGPCNDDGFLFFVSWYSIVVPNILHRILRISQEKLLAAFLDLVTKQLPSTVKQNRKTLLQLNETNSVNLESSN